MLELNHTLATMLMRNLFSQTEMDYDSCIADFERLLELTEKILKLSSAGVSSPFLSFDMGVIPGLFYTSLKCRESSTRHRALELLNRAPEREGIWHRHTIATAAALKIAMEEAWIEGHPGMGRPPESARMYREQVKDGSDDGSPAMLSFKRGAMSHAVYQREIRGLVSRLGDVM